MWPYVWKSILQSTNFCSWLDRWLLQIKLNKITSMELQNQVLMIPTSRTFGTGAWNRLRVQDTLRPSENCKNFLWFASKPLCTDCWSASLRLVWWTPPDVQEFKRICVNLLGKQILQFQRTFRYPSSLQYEHSRPCPQIMPFHIIFLVCKVQYGSMSGGFCSILRCVLHLLSSTKPSAWCSTHCFQGCGWANPQRHQLWSAVERPADAAHGIRLYKCVGWVHWSLTLLSAICGTCCCWVMNHMNQP